MFFNIYKLYLQLNINPLILKFSDMFGSGRHPLPVVRLEFWFAVFLHRFAGDQWEIDAWIVSLLLTSRPTRLPQIKYPRWANLFVLPVSLRQVLASASEKTDSNMYHIRFLSKVRTLQYFGHRQIVGLLLGWWPRADSVPASLSWGLLKDVQNSVRSTRISADPSSEYSQSCFRLHRNGLVRAFGLRS